METNIIKYEKINPIFTDTNFSKFAKSIINTNIIMKATELRIGNYIEKSLKSGQGRKVIDRVTFTNLQRIFEDSGSMNFDPIPLTEEILLKCGFENKVNYFTLYISELETTEIERKKIDIWFFEQRTVAELCRSGVCFSMVTCNYLHQLQNLYFALTGQELEINL